MRKRKEHQLPKVGSIFKRKHHGKLYKLRVIQEQGKIAFNVNGRSFKTASAASKSITKYESNGWRFWHIGE
jgi:hypothetical protein